MRLIDAFNGNPLQTFAGHLNNKGIPVEGGFSPDSQVGGDNSHLKFGDIFLVGIGTTLLKIGLT